MIKIFGVLALLATFAQAHSSASQVTTVYGIFRHDCYDKFAAFDLSDSSCVKFTFSKVIGFAIVVGAFALKVPQIIKILKNNSVEGINTTSYYVETVNYLSTAALSIHLGLDFWVYGETFVIVIQNLIVILLMWSMNSKIGAVEKVGFVFVTSTISYILFEGTMMTDQTWALVSSGSILLNMSARVP